VVKIIYQTYHPQQGRYPRVSGQARILREAGLEVKVLACDREGLHPESEVLDGIAVSRLRIPTGEMRGPLRQLRPLLRFYRRALAWFREHPADIVQCHNLDVLPLGVILKRRTGCRLVFEAHEPNYYALWTGPRKALVGCMEALDSWLARRCDAISVTNYYQVEKYRGLGVPRVELMGNYPPPELRRPEVPAEKLSAGETVFGRFGTFYPDVGLEATLEAFAAARAHLPGARLLLGGRVVDAYRPAFDAALQRFPGGVEYLGAYPAGSMRDLYDRIHVSVLAYPRSAWFRNITPRKFFDSICNGVPVIMTDIGGLGEVVRTHDCGVVVDHDRPQSMADAMLELSRNRARLRELTENALRLANTEYSWEGLRTRYLAMIEALHAR